MKKNYLSKLKFFSIVCVLSYFCAFFSYFFEIKSNFSYYENLYSQMITQTGDFNATITTNTSSTPSTKKETARWNNAIDIVDFAWNQLQEASCYEYQIFGSVVILAGPMEKRAQIHMAQIHYEDGSTLEEIKIYDTQSIANQTGATLRYYYNGKVYSKKGSITKVNDDGTMESSYSGNFQYDRDQDKHYSYIFSKNALSKDLYFKVNYNNFTGKIESYSASVTMNTKTSIAGYDEQVKINGGLDSLPSFQTLEAHCLISPDGHLRSITVKEVYTAKYVFGVRMNYESSSTFNITPKNVNGTLSLEKPIIN